jgi:hypothetical protein
MELGPTDGVVADADGDPNRIFVFVVETPDEAVVIVEALEEGAGVIDGAPPPPDGAVDSNEAPDGAVDETRDKDVTLVSLEVASTSTTVVLVRPAVDDGNDRDEDDTGDDGTKGGGIRAVVIDDGDLVVAVVVSRLVGVTTNDWSPPADRTVDVDTGAQNGRGLAWFPRFVWMKPSSAMGRAP